MSEEVLYERYKGALRNGHVASVRGRNEDAIAAYAEAATLAPDRPLPLTSMGRTQLKLGRVDDALTAFAAALRLAPRDEAGLTGRADALVAAGRPAEAAGVLDLLADTQQTAGRLPDACDTARRALELAESRSRRRSLEALVRELQSWPPEGGGADQLARALGALETPVVAPSPPPSEPSPVDEVVAVQDRVPVAADQSDDASPPPGDVLPTPVDLGPPPDVAALSLAIEAAVSTGDPQIVHRVVLDSVAELRRGGLLDAAVDACQLGLIVAPADPDLHLTLAELDLDQGWRAAAAQKLALLERFVDLTADDPARERIRAIVAMRLSGDGRPTGHPA